MQRSFATDSDSDGECGPSDAAVGNASLVERRDPKKHGVRRHDEDHEREEQCESERSSRHQGQIPEPSGCVTWRISAGMAITRHHWRMW